MVVRLVAAAACAVDLAGCLISHLVVLQGCWIFHPEQPEVHSLISKHWCHPSSCCCWLVCCRAAAAAAAAVIVLHFKGSPGANIASEAAAQQQQFHHSILENCLTQAASGGKYSATAELALHAALQLAVTASRTRETLGCIASFWFLIRSGQNLSFSPLSKPPSSVHAAAKLSRAVTLTGALLQLPVWLVPISMPVDVLGCTAVTFSCAENATGWLKRFGCK
jgi:hypothetical protein